MLRDRDDDGGAAPSSRRRAGGTRAPRARRTRGSTSCWRSSTVVTAGGRSTGGSITLSGKWIASSSPRSSARRSGRGAQRPRATSPRSGPASSRDARYSRHDRATAGRPPRRPRWRAGRRGTRARRRARARAELPRVRLGAADDARHERQQARSRPRRATLRWPNSAVTGAGLQSRGWPRRRTDGLRLREPSLPPAEVDIAALYARLRRRSAAPAATDRAATRGARRPRGLAERIWAVTAERPLVRRPGLKGALALSAQEAAAAADALVRRAARIRAADVQRRRAEADRRAVEARPTRRGLPAARAQADRGARGVASASTSCAAPSSDRQRRPAADGRLLGELEERLTRTERRRRRAPRRSRPSRADASRTTSPSSRSCAARPSRARPPAARTSTTSATPRRCSTSAAAAASSSRFCATRASTARGIDPDADMVAFARGEGLDVEQADAVVAPRGARGRLARRHLHGPGRRAPAGGDARAHARARGAKLRPGGVLVAETINPLSPLALRNYFADLDPRAAARARDARAARAAGRLREVETRFCEPAERWRPGRSVDAGNVGG